MGLLAVINKLINGARATADGLALAFIGLALLKVSSNYLSQLLLVTFAQKTIFKIGHGSVLESGARAYRTLDAGAPMKFSTLTDDTNAMAWAVNGLPGLAINVAILAGCSLYLAWLSGRPFSGS